VYIVVVALTVGSVFFDTSDDAVTVDKIEAIQKNLVDIENDIEDLNDELDGHSLIQAHPAQGSRTEDIIKRLDDTNERLKYLERMILDWQYQNNNFN
jgi:tetrahydromethanopterin S-methyltransferase subunit G